uniref:Myosin heavy chain-like protein n=1 Tax=Oryza sativa subsp. indica TaxID=39946 RepID=C8TFN0_ORYSI|nr:myosin heavy chain-like protein [Oryza sativa Indica Group]
MEEIPSKHAARIGEETSNGIYTGACHVLACVRLALPKLDLRKILDQGATSDARKDVMEEVGDLGESVLPLFEEDVDVEDVQQRGQPELPVIVPLLASEPHVLEGDVDRNLESALADQDRRIQYWRTKFEVAELERTMLEVRKDQAVETLWGRELHLEFLREGFSHSRRTPTEIDGLAKLIAPLAEKVFQSMDWRWPSW